MAEYCLTGGNIMIHAKDGPFLPGDSAYAGCVQEKAAATGIQD
jgi:hypothetical protein